MKFKERVSKLEEEAIQASTKDHYVAKLSGVTDMPMLKRWIGHLDSSQARLEQAFQELQGAFDSLNKSAGAGGVAVKR